MLHDLKEAPARQEMVAILPAGPLQKCRAADTAAEVESYTRYILLLRQFAGSVSNQPEITRFHGSLTPADTPAPFTLRASACIAARYLLPRGRKTAPECALSEHDTWPGVT